jgi:hypothetical protein
VTRRFVLSIRQLDSYAIRFIAALALLITPLIAADTTVAGHATAPSIVTRGPDDADSSCFLGRIAHPQGKAIADATVFIAMVRTDGTLVSQGTGFIAAGSASLGTTGPRIVTAAHVVAPHEAAPNDARFMVFFSDGDPIGAPRVVATGQTHSVLVGTFDVTADDVAVLEIADFADAKARGRFAKLAGLPINSDAVLRVGEASDPIGAVWGFSGAAAIDREGRVIGVLTGADFRGRVTLDLGSIDGSNATGRPVTRPVTLPRRSLIVVEPLHAREILQALGPAVIHQSEQGEATAVFAGFPLASCAATSAKLEGATSAEGAALLARWQATGQEDAWLLPPRLDATKLKLSP